MPALRIGRAEVPYELRRSSTARERRITVTPGHVEVMALSPSDIHGSKIAENCQDGIQTVRFGVVGIDQQGNVFARQ